ncbi:RNase H domain-containing protein [Trichonephila clavipes]|nr:RNase H domain-containing protein [Trichonephila clavipes]
MNLNPTSLDIIQEPCFPVKPPPSAKIILYLLEPCTKRNLRKQLKWKDMDTIVGRMKPCLVTACTDGQIASNFTCKLRAIRTALDIYLTRTNIANFDSIIVLSDFRSALEAIKEGKMGLTQEINSLLFSNGAVVSETAVGEIIQNVGAALAGLVYFGKGVLTPGRTWLDRKRGGHGWRESLVFV